MAEVDQFERISRLLSPEQSNKIKQATVLVAGIGGVGSYAAESLVRCGIGKLIIIDADSVEVSNLNRQLEALHSTIGQPKVEVMKNRLLDINPQCQIKTWETMLTKDNLADFFGQPVDYIVDAIDTISCKLDLISYAQAHQIPLVSSLGMANRYDPTKVMLTTLDKTSDDPLAKSMRNQGRKRNLDLKIPVAFSTEKPVIASELTDPLGTTMKQRHQLGSLVFVPAAAGLALGYAVIKDLFADKKVIS